ncbi:glycosyltransferase [Candidatus Saccharibacteria bacterium]|nr:MAG: glycosyltransferase [Candidatus Saccharibacteria bacterium]
MYANYALLQDSRIVPVELNHEQLVRKPKYSLLRGSVNGITLLIPRSILSDVGEFDEELRCTQDYDLWCRAFRKYDFVHMEEILTVTRIHGAQDSAVSPNVVKEGDILWKRLIEELSDKEKIEYENTVYNYYYEMSKFLRTTPYKGALAYSLDKEKESLEKTKHNESEKLVTVVIPFRNRVNDTLNSIKSVQEQTYKNTEIILIDDASTEDVSSLENYVKNLQNASLISLEKNLGPGGARNVGIRVAKGEYVAFLDSDDEFISEKLQTQIEAMRLHNPHVSYTAYTKKTETDESVIGGYGISGVVIPRLISSCPIATPTVIVRRKILLDEGIFFDESIRVGEDTCFWLEIAKKHEILYVDKPLTVVNVNASTNAYDSKKFIIGLKNILAYLLNDKYYSSFSYDIALLCNDYYQVNRSDRLMYENGLVLEDYWKPSVSQFIKHKLKKSLPYLVVRKFRANGLRGVAAAVVKRAKIRT